MSIQWIFIELWKLRTKIHNNTLWSRDTSDYYKKEYWLRFEKNHKICYGTLNIQKVSRTILTYDKNRDTLEVPKEENLKRPQGREYTNMTGYESTYEFSLWRPEVLIKRHVENICRI